MKLMARRNSDITRAERNAELWDAAAAFAVIALFSAMVWLGLFG